MNKSMDFIFSVGPFFFYFLSAISLTTVASLILKYLLRSLAHVFFFSLLYLNSVVTNGAKCLRF